MATNYVYLMPDGSYQQTSDMSSKDTRGLPLVGYVNENGQVVRGTPTYHVGMHQLAGPVDGGTAYAAGPPITPSPTALRNPGDNATQAGGGAPNPSTSLGTLGQAMSPWTGARDRK